MFAWSFGTAAFINDASKLSVPKAVNAPIAVTFAFNLLNTRYEVDNRFSTQ